MAHAEPSPFKFGYYYDIDKDEADGNDPQLYHGERHILLFGLNGAGKSTRILIENLVTIKNRSLVVIDVKGELAAQTARTRRTLSDVKIINPYNLHDMGSDGYNPLTVLDPDDDEFYDKAKQLALAMIEIGGDSGNNKYFTQSAAGWFCGGIMWEVVQAKRAARVPSLLRAREWCLEPDQYGPGPDGKESLVTGVRINAQRMVTEGSREIANLAGRFAREEPLTRGDQDVLQTLNTETEFLVSPPIARDLEKGEWGFSQLREKITTVYIVLPMHQLADKRRWIRVIITAALFAHLKPSPLKTLFILDEFKAAIGDLQIVNQFWALVRGYGVQFMPVCQSILQLKELFKDEWENLAAQAGAVATIGPAGDMATAEWMSKRGGNTSIWAQGWNEGQGINPQQGGMPTSNMGETRSQLARAVMLPQEIMSMKEGTGLIWLSGEGERLFPYYAPNYWDRPELSGLIDDNPMRPGATSSPGAAGASRAGAGSADQRRADPSPPPSGSSASMQRTFDPLDAARIAVALVNEFPDNHVLLLTVPPLPGGHSRAVEQEYGLRRNPFANLWWELLIFLRQWFSAYRAITREEDPPSSVLESAGRFFLLVPIGLILPGLVILFIEWIVQFLPSSQTMFFVVLSLWCLGATIIGVAKLPSYTRNFYKAIKFRIQRLGNAARR